jgi:hypothetical protein
MPVLRLSTIGGRASTVVSKDQIKVMAQINDKEVRSQEKVDLKESREPLATTGTW